MLNKVMLGGNLTRNMEVTETENNFVIGKTAIAVNEKYKTKEGEVITKTTFIDIEMYGERVKKLSQYLTKGKPVIVEGKLVLDSWVTETGDKRHKHKIVIEKVSFINCPKDETPEPEKKETKKTTSKKTPKKEEPVPEIDVDDEDVPF